MRPSHHTDLRAALRKDDDGLTARQLSARLDLPVDSVQRSLRTMPDVYIDRYVQPVRTGRRTAAVYCAVPVPEDAPKPTVTRRSRATPR